MIYGLSRFVDFKVKDYFMSPWGKKEEYYFLFFF